MAAYDYLDLPAITVALESRTGEQCFAWHEGVCFDLGEEVAITKINALCAAVDIFLNTEVKLAPLISTATVKSEDTLYLMISIN